MEACIWKQRICIWARRSGGLRRSCGQTRRSRRGSSWRLFETADGVVTAKVTQHEFDTAQSEQFVSERFGGSLPAFVAAFTAGKKLKPEEVAELKALIDAME